MNYSVLSLIAFSFVLSHPVFSMDAPICASESSDVDGDGWGWENDMSCVVSIESAAAACVDSDGDGYGWDGTATCLIENTPLVTGACIDSDGDGFGWDGQSTCFVSDVPVTEQPVVVTPVLPTACIDTDPVDDTWGWNGVTSCRVLPVLVGGDTSAIAGIWDASDEYDEEYTVITANGLIGDIYASFEADGSKCYEVFDGSPTQTDATVMMPLGGNRYRLDYVGIYNDEVETASIEYTIYVTAGNVLHIEGTFDEEFVALDFPAATIDVDDLDVCESY